MTTLGPELGAYAQRAAHRLPVDEAAIADLRRAAEGPLDPDYEAFLREHGGVAFSALVEFDLPPGCPWGERGMLTELFGRFDDGRGDALVEREGFASEIGPGWLPVGRDPGGNLLVLRTEGEGGVWLWDHERRPTVGDMAPSDFVVTALGERFHRVAASFADFVNGLHGRSWDDSRTVTNP
ncbi:SMI1/KNR4 family protein [Nocardia testacea]|uniref:SMI1/KNR4 family protein n=1 Tax=Nocardia testacea TaxID=248551 RepID=A0ABW7VQ34_9NOCA